MILIYFDTLHFKGRPKTVQDQEQSAWKRYSHWGFQSLIAKEWPGPLLTKYTQIIAMKSELRHLRPMGLILYFNTAINDPCYIVNHVLLALTAYVVSLHNTVLATNKAKMINIDLIWDWTSQSTAKPLKLQWVRFIHVVCERTGSGSGRQPNVKAKLPKETNEKPGIFRTSWLTGKMDSLNQSGKRCPDWSERSRERSTWRRDVLTVHFTGS